MIHFYIFYHQDGRILSQHGISNWRVRSLVIYLESIQNTEIGMIRSKFRLLPLFGTFVAEKSSSELSAFAISIFSWPR